MKNQWLRINRFGPFRNPFITTGRPGTFNGIIRAIVSDDNGNDYVDLEPKSFALSVGPSLEITEFQPLFADCGAPAIRALQGIAYRFGVKATGIAPVRFEYEVAKVNDVPGITAYEHSFNAPVAEDFIGESEPVFFNPVQGEQFYVTSIKFELMMKMEIAQRQPSR